MIHVLYVAFRYEVQYFIMLSCYHVVNTAAVIRNLNFVSLVFVQLVCNWPVVLKVFYMRRYLVLIVAYGRMLCFENN